MAEWQDIENIRSEFAYINSVLLRLRFFLEDNYEHFKGFDYKNDVDEISDDINSYLEKIRKASEKLGYDFSRSTYAEKMIGGVRSFIETKLKPSLKKLGEYKSWTEEHWREELPEASYEFDRLKDEFNQNLDDVINLDEYVEKTTTDVENAYKALHDRLLKGDLIEVDIPKLEQEEKTEEIKEKRFTQAIVILIVLMFTRTRLYTVNKQRVDLELLMRIYLSMICLQEKQVL